MKIYFRKDRLIILGAILTVFISVAILAHYFPNKSKSLPESSPVVTQDKTIDEGIIFNRKYVLRWDDLEDPWRNRSRDLYVIPRETKRGWVRFDYVNDDGFGTDKIEEFLSAFTLVEEE